VIWAAVLLRAHAERLEIKLVGAAPRVRALRGLSDKTLTVVTFAISGALAGLARHHRGGARP